MAATKRKIKFDSKFEEKLYSVLANCEYHTEMIPYVQYKNYEPDFTYVTDSGIIYIEAKGRFRDSAEARKYVDIRESLPEEHSLVFVFQNPYTAMPNAKRRRDGTKFTHAEWATKNNFEWYSPHELPREWIEC